MQKLGEEEISRWLERVKGWEIKEKKIIEKVFELQSFKEALDFAIKVGELAERRSHHPDLMLFGWNKLKVSLTTHSAGGLSEADFTMAQEIDLIGHDFQGKNE